jgi:hypothetical protein
LIFLLEVKDIRVWNLPHPPIKEIRRKTITAIITAKEPDIKKLKSGIVFTLMFVIAGMYIFAVSVGV